MKNVKVDLGSKSYNIRIGSKALKTLPGLVKEVMPSAPVVVISDLTVKKKTSKVYSPVLDALPGGTIHIAVPASERSKSIDVFQKITARIARKTKMHRPLIIALGGGVTGDLAGFVAATYRRGVPLIQVPTTLLADVDSSIGGKVGVDLPEAKNLVGAFKQPDGVIIDTDFLKTLPLRQLRNGISEVIKYGIIHDRKFFAYLEKNIKNILSLKKDALEKVIYRCAFIKARVVEKDEFDTRDVRIKLNFGHTLGHAVESAAGYSQALNHGEAVALGMLMVSDIAFHLDILAEENLIRIRDLIKRAGLPVRARSISLNRAIEAYYHDKKFTKGSNRFVLPLDIGRVEVIEGIPELLIKNVVKKYVG